MVAALLRNYARKLPVSVRGALGLALAPRTTWPYLRDCAEFHDYTRPIVETLRRDPRPGRGVVLINSLHSFVPALKEEFIYGAILARAGFDPVYLVRRTAVLEKYLVPLPGARLLYWNDYYREPGAAEFERAERLLAGVGSISELVALEKDEVAIGRHALSWLMRRHRLGSLDLKIHAGQLRQYIADSLAALEASRRLLETIDSTVVIMNERGYTPFGELFDLALAAGRRVVQYVASHRDDARVYKRYTSATRTEHPHGLSEATWRQVLSHPFTASEKARLLETWKDRYVSKQWFNFQRLQHRTRLMSPDEVRTRLGFDTSRKIAVVFAHIFWDATFFYGESLYEDYQRWLIETIRIANHNPAVFWVIKLHPVNMWRSEADGTTHQRYSEVEALAAERINPAEHVRLLMPETEISTWSEEARDRALRYGYWLLKRKPFRFGTFEMAYSSERVTNHAFNGKPLFHTTDPEELLAGPAASAWIEWLVSGQNEDLLGLEADE